MPSVPLLAGGLVILLALSKIFYNIFLHPLRSYPGPWYAKATIFWSQYHAYKGNLTYLFTTFDVIGHLAFAESFGCLQNSEYHPWIEFMFSTIRYGSMMGALKRVEASLAALVKNMIPERIRKQREKLYSMTDELVMRRRSTEPSYTDFMTHLLGAEQGGKLTMPDVFAQAPILVIAGSETTATLLSGGTYHLLTNRRVYDRVVSEIRGRFADQSEINVNSISELKYLLAFFDEALRMYPPAANNLPRMTPPQGATILGKWVPGNTAVGIHQYAQFHSPANFADPEVFAPERFLETGDPKWENDRRDALQPFSFGPRNCIGRNLAYVEMRLILASILWNFDMELVSGQENWIDQKIYLVWEKHPLMVKLTPVKR
ncbi:putative cytochrome p450 protein [Lasiodiplodia theobromae]|nr:putative cytochrome p450 protein [Lasiodiplodia theobromae]